MSAAEQTADPLILPAGWTRVDLGPDVVAYQRKDGLKVLSSISTEADGKPWLHVSVSRRSRLPTWRDLTECKDIFVGRDRKAIQVLPEESEYVNVHQFCLHMWHCLEGDTLPDFTRGNGII